MAKRRGRKIGKAEGAASSEMIPHPRSVGKHFTPRDVEQHGLGPAFFAVVAAIIILLLLSVFGNNYLTGNFHAGRGITYKQLLFSSSILTNGTDQALTVWVRSPDRNSYFQFYTANVSAFYVLEKNYSAHHPEGSLIYREGSTLRYQRMISEGAGPNSYGLHVPYRFNPPAAAGPFFVRLVPRRSVEFEISEIRAIGTWRITFTIPPEGYYRSNVQSVRYTYSNGTTVNVGNRWVSPAGSGLRWVDPSRVILEYAYNP